MNINMSMKAPQPSVKFLTGLIFSLFGVVMIMLSLTYKVGSSTEFGPGFFPLITSCALTLIGVINIGTSVSESETFSWSIQPLMIISASLLVFSIAMSYSLGLVWSITLTTIVANFALPKYSIKETVLLSLALSLICYLIFVIILSVNVPLWVQ